MMTVPTVTVQRQSGKSARTFFGARIVAGSRAWWDRAGSPAANWSRSPIRTGNTNKNFSGVSTTRCGAFVGRSAREEARALFRMLGRNGDDVNSLRALIGVSEKERAQLADWAACTSPLISLRIEAMVTYRQEVLLQFDRLVASAQ